MKKICYVVGASKGSFSPFIKNEGDYIIACDKGFKYLQEASIIPDLVVGDFDSLGYIPHFKNKIVLPCQKDVTDTHFAIEEGIKLGYKEFVLYGCLGGREEHSFASIQELFFFKKKGVNVILKSKDKTLEVLMNETKEYEGKGFISVFSLSDVCEGVTLKNLKYELNNATLTNDFPLGVSNEFTNKKATISIHNGCLLIIY